MCDKKEYDIIIAGGGTAGSAAAVAAARRGQRVLLVEEQNCLGGVSTSGGVGEWFASLTGMGDIFSTIINELRQFGIYDSGIKFFNQEYLKIIWQLMAEKAGVDILFHASIYNAECHDGKVTEVSIACCSKIIIARAKYFIDATGEGDLCALAGAGFAQGDPESRRVLHMTLAAWMYDTGKTQLSYLPAGLDVIDKYDDLPGLGSGFVVDKNRVYMNATKVMGYDPTDPVSLSKAECEARRQLIRIVHYLQNHGFPTYALASSGSKIGIREGRRVIGDYILSKDEVINQTEPLDFYDGVSVATSQIDFHSLTKSGNSGWRQKLTPYSIPLRCMTARNFKNLLMAGKCISVDQVVHSSTRMSPTCCMMGQAVGTAAAMAAELGCGDIHDLPITELRRNLINDGMELDPRKHTAFAPHNTRLDDDDGLTPGTTGVSPA